MSDLTIDDNNNDNDNNTSSTISTAISLDKYMRELDELGCTVIPHVLTKHECADTI